MSHYNTVPFIMLSSIMAANNSAIMVLSCIMLYNIMAPNDSVIMVLFCIYIQESTIITLFLGAMMLDSAISGTAL